jgi:hypothetical protein
MARSCVSQSPLEAEDVAEGLRDGAPARQQAVIAHDHDLAAAEVRDEPLLLVALDHHALVVMIGDARPATSDIVCPHNGKVDPRTPA